MLYKVTPMIAPDAQKARPASEERRVPRRRRSAVYDSEGHEVLISLMCLKCRRVKPLGQFGLRKMPDGAVRNQPWCKECRGAAGLARIGTEGAKSESVPASSSGERTAQAASREGIDSEARSLGARD
jgi:hypothetical protein